MQVDILHLARAFSELDKTIRGGTREQLVILAGALAARTTELAHRLQSSHSSCNCTHRALAPPGGDLSVKAAAELLGVAERTVYRLASTGRLKGSYHIGRSLRIPRGALEEVRGATLRDSSPHANVP